MEWERQDEPQRPCLTLELRAPEGWCLSGFGTEVPRIPAHPAAAVDVVADAAAAVVVRRAALPANDDRRGRSGGGTMRDPVAAEGCNRARPAVVLVGGSGARGPMIVVTGPSASSSAMSLPLVEPAAAAATNTTNSFLRRRAWSTASL